MLILPNNEKLAYSGRIDFENPLEPIFIYPCTSVRMRFTGNVLKIHIRNNGEYWDNYLGHVLDGSQGKVLMTKRGDMVIDLTDTISEVSSAMNDSGDVHEAIIFKRQDSCHELTLLGLEVADGERVLDVADKPTRRMEVFGDSVSAGEVSEAVRHAGRQDPEHNGEYSNSWYSYAWIAARRLGAEIYNNSQGGIALLDGTGWFNMPDTLGMMTTWNKLHYNPYYGELTKWDFTRYVPHVVIVAIGQNDSNPHDYMKDDYDGDKAGRWRESYKALLANIRNEYEDASIICCTTLLMHDESWDASIGQAVREMNDENITQYLFKRNGNGTPGHPRIQEAEEMADELVEYINGIKIKGWNKT